MSFWRSAATLATADLHYVFVDSATLRPRPVTGPWRSFFALIFLEGLLFTALGPLLPTLKAELGLSTSQAGFLAAGYVAGTLIGAAPAALASSRLGVKTCALTGVALMAGGTLAFGICGTFGALLVSQIVAGLGAAGLWIGGGPWWLGTSRSGERGAAIGAVLGVTAAGQIMGPVVGGVAASVGRTVTFTCVALPSLFFLFQLARVTPPPPGARSLELRASAASRAVRTALWLCFFPSIVWGAVFVLGTLQLADLGASSSGIAVTFVIAAAIGAVEAPVIGRWSDRRGRLLPIRVGLLMCIPALVALSWAENRLAVGLLVISFFVAIRFTIAPAGALLSDACRESGGGDVLALAAWLPAGAGGLAVGAAVSGVLAQAAGSAWTYNAFAAAVFVVLLVLIKQTEPSHNLIDLR